MGFQYSCSRSFYRIRVNALVSVFIFTSGSSAHVVVHRSQTVATLLSHLESKGKQNTVKK